MTLLQVVSMIAHLQKLVGEPENVIRVLIHTPYVCVLVGFPFINMEMLEGVKPGVKYVSGNIGIHILIDTLNGNARDKD